MSGSILGTRVKRIEDPKMLTVGGSYINDLPLDGALYVTYVRSTMAHARLRSIDVDDARTAAGVVAVYTFPDLGMAPSLPMMPFMNQAMLRPMLAHDTVRFVGEPIVAILAETRAAGADAAELVSIDYEPLPVIVDPEVALTNDVLLFPEVGTNVVCEIPASSDEDIFAGCEVVVEARLVNNRLAPAPMEPRVAAAVWDGTRLTQWAAGQGVFGAQGGIARLNGLDISKVRIITPDVGGSFGAKGGTSPEELLVGWLSCQHARPVRWLETRTENMTAMAQGRAQIQYAKLGGTRDGKLLAYSLKVIQESGGYPSLAALLPNFTKLMASGTYDIPKISAEAVTVLTNTTPVGAYRGAGRPEATAAMERLVDIYAAEIGMDPGELRRRNVIAPSAFPYTTQTGASYDSGEYALALDRALDAAGYADLRAEQAQRRRNGDRKLLGIGMASYVEVTNPMGSGEWASVEVKPDGGAIVRSGVSAHGQGLGTAFVMLASERTGIPMERMEYHQSDTDEIPRGGGTGGSRSLQVGGSAVCGATDLLVEHARQLAADQLEANLDDIVLDLDSGNFHVVGTPAKSIGWAELARAQDEPLSKEFDFKPDGATFPFGAHVAVVEIDRDTGQVTVQRLVAVDDCGTIVNPLLADGQVHGGIAQGIAQALLEEVRFDELGNPLTANFADYAIISAAELPSFERHPMQTPTPRNPLGAKGIGESGTIGSTPAVQNAVVDALAHLGTRHLDMPFTAERVWREINGEGLMRILVSDTIFRDYEDQLNAAAPTATFLQLLPDGTVTDSGAPDVVFISNDVFYGPIKACMQIVTDTPQLAWLQSAAAGVEAPAFRAHLERGGRLTRAHVTAVPISEYVMQAVLACFQQPHRLTEQRAARIWQHVPFREVWRTTWLIVGLGSIGREVAKRARSFDAHVIGVRRTPDGTEPVDEILTSEHMLDAVARADVVVIAAELNDGNRHLVDATFLAAMRPGSCFVNVARGGLVDEAALLDALDRDAPASAVLDVFETEPLPPDSVWWTHPKVIMSPHSSGGGNGRIVRATEVFLENLRRYGDGRELIHEVRLADLPAQPTVWHVEKR